MLSPSPSVLSGFKASVFLTPLPSASKFDEASSKAGDSVTCCSNGKIHKAIAASDMHFLRTLMANTFPFCAPYSMES
ncbi:hypothetical protein ACFX2G_010816 [Malus domestica]